MSDATGIMKFRRMVDSWWTVGVIALLIGFIVYQKWHHVPADYKPTFLTVGESLAPTFALETPDGPSAVLQWAADSRPTLLYVFQPACVWCSRNRDNLQTVLEHASNYRVIGLSLTQRGLKDYVARNGYKFPVYVPPNQKSIAQLKLHATPETLIVSPSGRVEKVWIGAYGGKMKNDIESTFGITLAGLERQQATRVAQ
jgi:hypothetical protein